MEHTRLTTQRRAAEDLLRSFGRVIVAFSGGVDSTLLAKLARDVLGKANALAVTADSPSFAREDLTEARRLAGVLDLEHLVIQTKEVKRVEYRANTESRCYFCKQTLFDELIGLACARAIPFILYGVLADDRLAERPGHRAALEYGIRAPLQEAGLTKPDIRELAKQMDLPNWNKPQNACLSSRIPHGEAVTIEKLKQIEAAESFLRAHGFRQVRVRHLGTHARIEVGAEEIARFNDTSLCSEIERQFGVLGFQTIGLDRAGYREGGASRATSDEVLLSAIGRC